MLPSCPEGFQPVAKVDSWTLFALCEADCPAAVRLSLRSAVFVLLAKYSAQSQFVAIGLKPGTTLVGSPASCSRGFAALMVSL